MVERTNITLAGDWGAPAQTLIEKVSDAVGGTVKPWQIRRLARAEGDAEVIRAEADLKVKRLIQTATEQDSDVTQRAIERMVNAEVKKQLNIEEITAKAAERLTSSAQPDLIEDDFLTDLFSKAENTSDAEMQSLWASILAGEANKRGSFSRRTLSIVGELFTLFCRTVCTINTKTVPIISEKVLSALNNGLDFESLTHLDSLGLIHFDTSAGFQIDFQSLKDGVNIPFRHFDRRMSICGLGRTASIAIGKAILTRYGAELHNISGAHRDDSVEIAIIEELIGQRLAIYSNWPRGVSIRRAYEEA